MQDGNRERVSMSVYECKEICRLVCSREYPKFFLCCCCCFWVLKVINTGSPRNSFTQMKLRTKNSYKRNTVTDTHTHKKHFSRRKETSRVSRKRKAAITALKHIAKK